MRPTPVRSSSHGPTPTRTLRSGASTLAQFHSVVSLAAELDPALSPLAGGGGLELSEDAATAVYQMAVASPLGSFDRHRVLCAPDVASRTAVLAELLDDATVLLRAQLDQP